LYLECGGEHVHLRQALEVIRTELLDVVLHGVSGMSECGKRLV
jgi:hypothetical protein